VLHAALTAAEGVAAAWEGGFGHGGGRGLSWEVVVPRKGEDVVWAEVLGKWVQLILLVMKGSWCWDLVSGL